MQLNIKILERWCTELDIICNTIDPKNLDRRISVDFPCFTLDNCKLKFVSQFRYLRHIINDHLKDDDDIKEKYKAICEYKYSSQQISTLFS